MVGGGGGFGSWKVRRQSTKVERRKVSAGEGQRKMIYDLCISIILNPKILSK